MLSFDERNAILQDSGQLAEGVPLAEETWTYHFPCRKLRSLQGLSLSLGESTRRLMGAHYRETAEWGETGDPINWVHF